MCSIIGWNGEFNESIIDKICKFSRVRGLHSFGYSFLDSEFGLKTLKFLNYNEFWESLRKQKPKIFIAHFRYSTSGDYKNNANNQPIQRGGTAMVFNGVLDMRTKKEMEEAYGVLMDNDNDGELAIIFKEISDQEFEEFIKNKSYAGAFIDETGIVKVYRNSNRPAHIGTISDARVLASTKDILNRAGVYNTKLVSANKFIEL